MSHNLDRAPALDAPAAHENTVAPPQPVREEEETEVAEPENPETDELPDALADEDTVLAEESDQVSTSTPAVTARPQALERSRLADRIRNSRKLPKGLRERLGEIVESVQLSDDGGGVPTVPVAEAVEMIEAAIPENLLFAEGPLETPAHPRGENFFTGDGSRLSDEDAQRVASEQLAATGFGPAK